MSSNNLFFSAAVLFVTAIPALPQFTSDAFASCSPEDKELFREARKIVMPYDAFSNSIIVLVRENVVTVSGHIDSRSAKSEIGESIASLKGVKNVRNEVSVRAH